MRNNMVGLAANGHRQAPGTSGLAGDADISSDVPSLSGDVDERHLELYYRTFDYFIAQAAAADTKAVAVLTVEAGLAAAFAVAVPLVAPHFPTLHIAHSAPAVLVVIINLVWLIVALTAIWLIVAFSLSTLGVWLSMATVLAWDHIDPPPVRGKRAFLRLLLRVLRTGELNVVMRQARRTHGVLATDIVGLPFNREALRAPTAAAEMACLDVAAALLAHVRVNADIANGKTRALREGLLSFLSQALWLILLVPCWYVLAVLAHY